jgi:hypothetical protein
MTADMLSFNVCAKPTRAQAHARLQKEYIREIILLQKSLNFVE